MSKKQHFFLVYFPTIFHFIELRTQETKKNAGYDGLHYFPVCVFLFFIL